MITLICGNGTLLTNPTELQEYLDKLKANYTIDNNGFMFRVTGPEKVIRELNEAESWLSFPFLDMSC